VKYYRVKRDPVTLEEYCEEVTGFYRWVNLLLEAIENLIRKARLW
jgi:hypothetical protein